MDLTIFIPTRGRTRLEHITINEMAKFCETQPVIVCPPEEYNHYNNYLAPGRVMPCPVQGIGPTRQWILENSPTRGVVMLDDDMYFSFRENPNIPTPLKRCEDLGPLWHWISEQLDEGFPHGGISARQGNQHVLKGSADCTRVNNAHFFDRNVFLAEGLRFDTLEVMEDFYITLSLLLRGYPNRVAYHYCWSQRGSGAKGGCSLYRTAEVQATAAHRLKALFPDYVRVVEKKSDSQVGVMASRTDVNIQWLKAWQFSQKYDLTYRPPGYQPAIPERRAK